MQPNIASRSHAGPRANVRGPHRRLGAYLGARLRGIGVVLLAGFTASVLAQGGSPSDNGPLAATAGYDPVADQLDVGGSGAAGYAAISVLYPADDVAVGHARAHADGTWTYTRYQAQPVPCSVTVDADGERIEVPVAGSPADCSDFGRGGAVPSGEGA